MTRGLRPEISRDGRYVAYLVDNRGDYNLRYSVISPDAVAGSAIALFKRTPEPAIYSVRFSPDGRYLAYVERQPGGALEVFVTRFPGGEGRWQISSGGGRSPVWASNNEIFFASGSNDGPKTIMSAAIKPGATPVIGAPLKLFAVSPDIEISPRGLSFDASADGQRFVMVRSRRASGPQSPLRWVLAQNWLSEFTAAR
jgi:Tol biopolymer transport system component